MPFACHPATRSSWAPRPCARDNPRLVVRSQAPSPRSARRPPVWRRRPIKVTVTAGGSSWTLVPTSSPRATPRSSSTAPANGVDGARLRLARLATVVDAGHLPLDNAQDQRGPRRPRRAAADGRGRRQGPHPVPDRRPRRRAATRRCSVFRRRLASPTIRSATDASRGTPAGVPTLAGVREIGDVVLLRYSLSPRFESD